ncbi:sensor histidine kinase [Aquipuribacter nitratireducens]|uniref:histidine kinase n=1 Tax=Aquipuribacter nitratireducens TaxID=650104 RepID=A0ABW0GPG6_9MICO
MAAAVAATVASAGLDAGNDPALAAALTDGPAWPAGVSGSLLAVAGLLVLRRAPRHLLGWVLVVAGVHWAGDALAAAWLVRAVEPVLAGGDPLPGAAPAFWVFQRLGAWLLLTLPLLLLLFPDGRLPAGRAWRVGALASLAATCLLPLLLLVVPAAVADRAAGGAEGIGATALGPVDRDLTSLVGVPEPVWSAALGVAYAAVPLSLVVPFAALVQRYRRGGAEERRTLRWLLWAGLVATLVMLATLVLPDALTSAALVVAVGVCALAVAAGIVRPRVLDIDALLSGTVVYAALAVALVAVDLGVLTAAGALLSGGLGEREAAVLALAVVAAAYLPLRDRVFRLARRLVLGEREDPYRVVSRLAERLEAAPDVGQELRALVAAVADAFRLPYVGVVLDAPDGTSVEAHHGERAPGALAEQPLVYRGEPIGRLLLPAGTGGPRPGSRDARLLADVVRQGAAAARAALLAGQLQRHRELLVGAREEERRRLRRDLHDGLGPLLGAVVLRVDTARRLAAAGRTQEADATLREARDEVSGGLAEVRRLVHDLRPPALDDVGLVGALRQQASRLSAAPGGPEAAVVVEGAPEELPGLPAAVEVAALRVAGEALVNVARHADAQHVRVTLRRLPDALHVLVVDDGRGIRPDAPAGVGLLSLRERAAELGGTAHVACPSSGGTTVHVVLPTGPAPTTSPEPGPEPAAEANLSRETREVPS